MTGRDGVLAADAPGHEPWVARYLEWMGVRGYALRSIESAKKNLSLFAGWCAERGLETPQEVSREVIERYQRWLFRYRRASGKALSFRSQHARLWHVRAYFRWLARERHVLYNPAAELELPRYARRQLPTQALSVGEVERVLAGPDVETAIGLRDRAVLETLYSTGIRRMELAALDVWDLDFERGWLVVKKGKGGKDRVVPIGERALAWVNRYLEESRPQLVVSPAQEALFLTGLGERWALDGLTQLVRRWVQASGIGKSGSCHLLRHTMATQMLEGGADVRFVQEMLGHASLESTQIYTHVAIGKLKAIHDAAHPGAKLDRRERHSEDSEGPPTLDCADDPDAGGMA